VATIATAYARARPNVTGVSARWKVGRTNDGGPVPADVIAACATLGHASPALLTLLDQRADWFVDDSGARRSDLAKTAAACEALGYPSSVLFEALERRADWLVGKGSVADAARLAGACATLDHRSPALFTAMFDRYGPNGRDPAAVVVDEGDDVDRESFAKIKAACAKLGHDMRIVTVL
jgi:hypothetical protein